MINNKKIKSTYDKKQLSRLKENYYDALGQSMKEYPPDDSLNAQKRLRMAEDALIAFAAMILPKNTSGKYSLAQCSGQKRPSQILCKPRKGIEWKH